MQPANKSTENKVGQLVNSQLEENYSLDSHQHLIPERLIDASQVHSFVEEQIEHSNSPSSNFQTQNQMPSIGEPSANANIPPFVPPSIHLGSSSICISPSSNIRSETSAIAFSSFGGTFAFPVMTVSSPLQDISPIQVSSCGQPDSNSKDARIHRAFETEKYTRNAEITNYDEKLTHLSNNSFHNKLELVNDKYGPMPITHKNVYTDQPTFACGYEKTVACCDDQTKAIGEEQTLARDDEQAFACDECEKIFTTKYNLIRHKIVHTNERPFSCDECGKTFKQKYELTVHGLLHYDECPFSCDICNKCYKYIENLINHRKTHQDRNQD